VQQFLSYQQCARFKTTLDFDHEYLWNGSSNRQAENCIIHHCFFHICWKQFGELLSTNENGLHLWPTTLKFNRFLEVVEIHVSAKFHQTECSSSWVIVYTNFFALSCNGKETKKSGPVTLQFCVFQAVVKVHFLQNVIELSAAVHELSSSQRKKTDESNTVCRFHGQ